MKFWLILAFALFTVFSTAYASRQHNSRTGSGNEYLQKHNAIRNLFHANTLAWSSDLAAKAQDWADACHFKHTDGALGPYGDNIAAGTGSFTIDNAINMFVQDAATFDSTNPSFSDFTQVVWTSTTQLGCASASCQGIFAASYGNATLHVCLYDPPGNIIGDILSNIPLSV